MWAGAREGGGLEEGRASRGLVEEEGRASRGLVEEEGRASRGLVEFENFVARERRVLGPLTFAEKAVTAHGLLLVILWFTRR